jgi:glycine oxidase
MNRPIEIAIAGAGLLGRLLAWQLARAGYTVQVFDPAPGPLPAFDGGGAAAFSAAGMLSPLAEMDHADASLSAKGWRSIALWRQIAKALGEPALFSQQGSLLLAHRSDLGAAQRVLERLRRAPADWPVPQPLSPSALTAIEPALHGAAHAWLLPDEAQVQPLPALSALHAGGESAGARFSWDAPVLSVQAGCLRLSDDSTIACDLAVDVRGLGARDDALSAPDSWRSCLRGVRGETAWLHLPDHGLMRPLRLLHPRHPVYVVPRGKDRVFVGASEIESEDRSEVSLRTAVELMAAAQSVMPALAESRIERLDRNLRPALPDNAPHIESTPGLLRINGLFRHGWLLAPALVEQALRGCGLDEALLPGTDTDITNGSFNAEVASAAA